ncbi:uncharacterized protein LOC143445473 [Clavelina lepadiformis]|uniref:Uncharacterized protein n=1 Tax=Clavelina lepadiformis TaxID=159417 RepID=A0ABP0GSW9_CLALP
MAPAEKWGTITPCRFPLGKQKMTNFEIQQSVEKLTMPRSRKMDIWWDDGFRHKKGNRESVDRIVTKLTTGASRKVPDSRRIAEGRILSMGVVNSFAWKGYN